MKVRRDQRRIESRFATAQALVREARTTAVSARDQLEYERGQGATPRGDSPTAADVALIVALDTYRSVYVNVDLPLRNALATWARDEDTRHYVLTTKRLLRALLSSAERASFAEKLTLATRCATATTNALNRDLTDSTFADVTRQLREAMPEHIEAAVSAYAQNSAASLSALERLNIVGTTPDGKRRPGAHGGLPEEIADAVERTTLHTGPLHAILRRYQEFGARYIVHQRRVLLGDDMGLGKTVQVLATICHLHHTGARHFLVVAPNSVMVNWEREVAKHTGLHPVMLHGVEREARTASWNLNGGVAITTYGTLSKIVHLVQHVDLLAVDEAHLVKNPAAVRTKAVTALSERCEYVVLMSGTSLENRLEEMQRLVLLAQPTMVRVLNKLTRSASGRVDPDAMYTALAPVYLRRTQSDVLTELPERIVTDEWVNLTTSDRDAYVNSPIDVMTRRLVATMGDGTTRSAKYERLLELIEDHGEARRKVVVFSFFRQVIDDVCALVGGAPQITGSTSAVERQRLIDQFTSDASCNVLVSQVDAGGLGINLQAAQVVVLMEAQFKPSTEWQAIARVHRMGQSRTVLVHRLLARGTIEERLVDLIDSKTQLFEAYANDSSVRDMSAMAMDSSSG